MAECICMCHLDKKYPCDCLCRVNPVYKSVYELSDKQKIEEIQKSYVALLNQCADLSMKIKMMQSDLREFEKQKVEPLQNRIFELEAKLEHDSHRFEKRIEKLESYMNMEDRVSACDILLRLTALEQASHAQRIMPLVNPEPLKNAIPCSPLETLVREKFTQPKNECQHEWDCNLIYTSYPPKLKCLKCGAYNRVTEFSKVYLGSGGEIEKSCEHDWNEAGYSTDNKLETYTKVFYCNICHERKEEISKCNHSWIQHDDPKLQKCIWCTKVKDKL